MLRASEGFWENCCSMDERKINGETMWIDEKREKREKRADI